jgi:drug/metabolite transporter (DMT)-like permease
LTPVTPAPDVHVPDPAKRMLAIYIVLACTLLVAIAQYLIKLGANRLSHAGLLATMIGIFTIPQLFAGYCLYGIFTVLFVWVTITAVLAFHESVNPFKIIGVAVIIVGVAVLGFGGGSAQ